MGSPIRFYGALTPPTPGRKEGEKEKKGWARGILGSCSFCLRSTNSYLYTRAWQIIYQACRLGRVPWVPVFDIYCQTLINWIAESAFYFFVKYRYHQWISHIEAHLDENCFFFFSFLFRDEVSQLLESKSGKQKREKRKMIRIWVLSYQAPRGHWQTQCPRIGNLHIILSPRTVLGCLHLGRIECFCPNRIESYPNRIEWLFRFLIRFDLIRFWRKHEQKKKSNMTENKEKFTKQNLKGDCQIFMPL